MMILIIGGTRFVGRALVETAVSQTIAAGHRTGDIARAGEKALGTEEITAVILQNL